MNPTVLTIGCRAGKGGFRDGNAREAICYWPAGITISHNNTVYFADQLNHRIRMIKDNNVSTVAGVDVQGFQDGHVIQAKFSTPSGICLGRDGILYITDTNNHRIRLIANHIVTTLAGNGTQGFKDGAANYATFNQPLGICISNNNTIVYITEWQNHSVRSIENGIVSTVAGNGIAGFQDGIAKHATFHHPGDICISPQGTLYVTDTYNHSIRIIVDNIVSTLAGDGHGGFSDGIITHAKFYYPYGLCMSNDGKLYIADYENHNIRMIKGNVVSTIVGNNQTDIRDRKSHQAQLNGPVGICVSRNGHLCVTERLNNTIKMINMTTLFSFHLFANVTQPSLLSDFTLTINGQDYFVHTHFLHLRCPGLLNRSCLSWIEKANISTTALNLFITYLYIDEIQDASSFGLDMSCILELLFIFDIFEITHTRIRRLLIQSFKKQLGELLKTDERSGVHKAIHLLVFALPLINLMDTKLNTHGAFQNYVRSTISSISNPSTIEPITPIHHIYSFLLHQLQQYRTIIKQYIATLHDTLPQSVFLMLVEELISETLASPADIIHDLPTWNEPSLFNLSCIAFESTTFNGDMPTNNILSERERVWCKPDFVIEIENMPDQHYHVHKFVLAGRWRYFTLMLQSGLAETRNDRMVLPLDWTPRRLEQLMKYIYKNEIGFELLEDVTWLLKHGEMYMLFEQRTRNEPSLAMKFDAMDWEVDDDEDEDYNDDEDDNEEDDQDDNNSDDMVDVMDDDQMEEQDEWLLTTFQLETIGCQGYEALHDHCQAMINAPLTLSNCIDMYLLYKEMKMETHLERCKLYMMDHYTTMMNTLAIKEIISNIQDETMREELTSLLTTAETRALRDNFLATTRASISRHTLSHCHVM